jgi:hypothetical protein
MRSSARLSSKRSSGSRPRPRATADLDHPQAAFGLQGSVEQWKGWVTAIDAETGTTKWKVQIPKPMLAAITATAGGLVFTGPPGRPGTCLRGGVRKGAVERRHREGHRDGVVSYPAGGSTWPQLPA